VAVPMWAWAQADRANFDSQLNRTLAKLNQLASTPEGADVLSLAVQREYEAPVAEIQSAASRGVAWSSIVALAYIRATTGESFAVLDAAAVERDFWEYTQKAGMSSEKMIRSLGNLTKRVESDRKLRILERARVSRRVTRLPDLGSGFGLLQETLDFRRLETPKPTKIHTTNP